MRQFKIPATEGFGMAMGRRKRESQGQIFIATTALAGTGGHPFYQRLNDALRAMDFDTRVEELCRKFYHEGNGRPGIPPGVYFRMLLIGYFEGIDSERGIAWRVADSLALRRFLGCGLDQETPDHSSLSRIRWRIDGDTHAAVFRMILLALQEAGLVKGKTIGVDATTLEANAAMRSIVRRDTGQSYPEYLEQLAQAAGIEEPTRSDIAKLDRKRPKKGSNEQWEHPHDKDAKIAKMKDGRTHLAHKAEHVVDLESGALLGVSLHEADKGDTQTMAKSVNAAFEQVSAAIEQTGAPLPERLFEEVVADKGYHSNQTCQELQEALGIRTYLSEPERGRRRWQQHPAEVRRAVYANRRRVKGDRGKRLQRMRGERLERSNAHMYETGAMRRTHLRGHENIMKRLIVHAAGFNLGLLMRQVTGIGKPRRRQDFPGLLWSLILWLWAALTSLLPLPRRPAIPRPAHRTENPAHSTHPAPPQRTEACSTGCYGLLGGAAVEGGEMVQDAGLATAAAGLTLMVTSAATYSLANLGLGTDAMTGETADVPYLESIAAYSAEGMVVGADAIGFGLSAAFLGNMIVSAGATLMALGGSTALIQVTSWASGTKYPDLNPGRWVILGNRNLFNYLLAGIPGKAPYNNFISDWIQANALQWPGWNEFFKGFWGQRIMRE